MARRDAMARITEAELYDTRQEAEVCRLLKEWIAADPSNRTAQLHITAFGGPHCTLKDRTVQHGCGHIIAGMATGVSFREAVDKAFVVAKRWARRTANE